MAQTKSHSPKKASAKTTVERSTVATAGKVVIASNFKAGASVVLSRKKLVGKFPEVKHQPAPKQAHYQLSDEDRRKILAQMILA